MIEIKIFCHPKGRLQGLETSGHAGLGEAGNDILCAAVSVLTENLGASLKLLLQLSVSVKAQKGYYSLQLPQEALSQESDLLFHSTILGLEVLARQYPARIRIIRPSEEPSAG